MSRLSAPRARGIARRSEDSPEWATDCQVEKKSCQEGNFPFKAKHGGAGGGRSGWAAPPRATSGDPAEQGADLLVTGTPRLGDLGGRFCG